MRVRALIADGNVSWERNVSRSACTSARCYVSRTNLHPGSIAGGLL